MSRRADMLTPAYLVDLLEAAGYEAASYSGRAMYGRQCVGVTVDRDQLLGLGAALAQTVFDVPPGGDPRDLEALAEVLESLRAAMAAACWDEMGKSSLVVYWPKKAWPGSRQGRATVGGGE